MVDASDICKPCLYIYTVGPLFYRGALLSASSTKKATDAEREIITNAENNAVTYLRNILIEAPTNPEEARAALLKAHQLVIGLDEVQKVRGTQEMLKRVTDKTRSAIDDILLIDYIAGECKVCRRMSHQ